MGIPTYLTPSLKGRAVIRGNERKVNGMALGMGTGKDTDTGQVLPSRPVNTWDAIGQK